MLISIYILLSISTYWLNAQFTHAKDYPFLFGTVTHFTQQKSTMETLNILNQLGGNTIREDIYWHVVEKEKGKYDIPKRWSNYIEEAVSNGIQPLLVLCYSNNLYDYGLPIYSKEGIDAFTKFCEFVVKYYKGKVNYYEIWNEWDGGMGNKCKNRMSPDSYLKILRSVYPSIKAIDPSITVLNAGVTGFGMRTKWMKELVKKGALRYIDGVSLHPYNFRKIFVQENSDNPESWIKFIQRFQRNLLKYSNRKYIPFYITEMGFPTFIGNDSIFHDYTPYEASIQYARSYLLIRTLPYVKGIWWYHLYDGGWDYNDFKDNFGLLRPDLTPKDSFYTLKNVSTLIADSKYIGRIKTSDSNIWVLKFRRRDNQYIFAIWSTHRENDWQIVLENRKKTLEPVFVYKAGKTGIKRNWGKREWTRQLYKLQPEESNRLDVIVNQMPFLVLGDLSECFVQNIIKREYPCLKRD